MHAIGGKREKKRKKGGREEQRGGGNGNIKGRVRRVEENSRWEEEMERGMRGMGGKQKVGEKWGWSVGEKGRETTMEGKEVERQQKGKGKGR